MSAEEFKKRGNDFVALKKYSEAIECYSAALLARCNDETRSASYCNRSLCYLHKNPPDFIKAADDAREALRYSPSMSKAYYRLACAMRALSHFEEAILAIDRGLAVDPTNKTLIELKKQCNTAIAASQKPESPLEARFIDCLRETLVKFKSSDLDEDDVPEGLLRDLFKRSNYKQLFAPFTGVDALPQDICELLCDTRFLALLASALTRIAKASVTVFQGITERGARDGQVMDEQTRSFVMSHIAQEALAREVVNLVPKYVAQQLEEQHKATASEAKTENSRAHVCHYLSSSSAVPRSARAWESFDENKALEMSEAVDASRTLVDRAVESLMEGFTKHPRALDELTQLQSHWRGHRFDEGLALGQALEKQPLEGIDDAEVKAKYVFLMRFFAAGCALSLGALSVAIALSRECILQGNKLSVDSVLSVVCWYIRSLAMAGMNSLYLTTVHARNSAAQKKLPGVDAVLALLKDKEKLLYSTPPRLEDTVVAEMKHALFIHRIFSIPRCIVTDVAVPEDFKTLLGEDTAQSMPTEGSPDCDQVISSLLASFSKLSAEAMMQVCTRCFESAQAMYEEELYLLAEAKYFVVTILIDEVSPEALANSSLRNKMMAASLLNIVSCRLHRGCLPSLPADGLRWKQRLNRDSLELLRLAEEICPSQRGSVLAVLCLENSYQFQSAQDRLRAMPVGMSEHGESNDRMTAQIQEKITKLQFNAEKFGMLQR